MFDKFGEFDSVEELNRAAAAQKTEGDEEALKLLAKENGIDEEEAEDYFDDCTPTLATPLMAALGKLKIEKDDAAVKGILEDWYSLLVEECTGDEQLQRAVRRKDKSLVECMAKLIAFAFENKVKVSDKIVKACKVKVNGKQEAMRSPLYLGIPNRLQVKEIVKEYYLGK